MQQDSGEPIRSFHAKVKGRAITCAYSVKCTCNPASDVDYTEWVIKDVLLNGLADGDIKRDILGLNELDTLTVEDLVARIESKETARNALQLNIPSNDSLCRYKDPVQNGETQAMVLTPSPPWRYVSKDLNMARHELVF